MLLLLLLVLLLLPLLALPLAAGRAKCCQRKCIKLKFSKGKYFCLSYEISKQVHLTCQQMPCVFYCCSSACCRDSRLCLFSCLVCLLCLPAVSESIKCSNFNQLFDNKFHELFKFDGNRNHKLTPFIGVAVGHGQGVMNKGRGKGLGKRGLANGVGNGRQLQALPLSELPPSAPQLNHKLHVLRTWMRTQVLLSNGVPPSSFPRHSLPLSVSTLIPLLVSFMLY